MSNASNRGGRPRRETVTVWLKLRLHPGEDDDLINFFASLPERGRARSVMAALRTGNIAQALADEGLDDDQMAEDMLGSFLR
ncbi:MAG: hypothetical protein JXM73_22175 [Anaerolineae bacterium]|nr:hypothetical protein [Anaerolineae bacterium]